MSKSSPLSVSPSLVSGDWKYLLVLTAVGVADVAEGAFPAARFAEERALGLTFLSSFSSFSVRPFPG